MGMFSYCKYFCKFLIFQITACVGDDGVVFTRQRGSGSEWEEHYCIDFNPGFRDLPSKQTQAVGLFDSCNQEHIYSDV